MSTNSQNKSGNEEVDLSMISRGIGNFFQNISTLIFEAIQFVLRHIIVIGILFAIGVGLGIYVDKTQKTYDHQVIVQPNFGSVEYLYAKIDLLESKIRENDTVFLQKIGITDASDLAKIEIKPIVDVYRFINSSEQNFELLKLMAEDSDIKKILEDKPTSKNYPYHLISFKTKSRITTKKMIDPLLAYFNDSDFFRKIQKEYVNNENLKLKYNEQTLAQINSFLDNVSGNSGKADKLVYYNENSPLNDVLKMKDKILIEQGNLRIDLISIDKIVKITGSTINIENKESINGKMKLVLPVLFVLLYISIFYFLSFYKAQKLKHRQ